MNKIKKKSANTFFILWLTGAPNVSIEINSDIVNFTDKNTDFLIIFMGGWTKYAIENPNDKDLFNGHMAGLKSVIKVYKMGKGVKKDKNVENLCKLYEDKKLEEWVKEQVKKK